MTLLNRLKPEFLQKLKLVKQEYPTSAEKIENCLEQNQSVFGLTIEDGSRICTFFDIDMTLNNLLNLIKDDE
jgi:hypothetical protein